MTTRWSYARDSARSRSKLLAVRWAPASAVALSAVDYTSSNHLWHATVSLAAGAVVQYKYISVASDGTVTWEADPNHVYTVPATCATTAVVSNSWQ